MLTAGIYLILIGVFLFLNGFVKILLLGKTITNVRAYVNLAYSIIVGGAILLLLNTLKEFFQLW